MRKLYFITIIYYIFISNLYGRQDFYHSFVSEDFNQISLQEKKKIIGGFNRLKAIRRLIREGQFGDALVQLEILRNSNNSEILKSNIILLNGEILYKMETKTKATQAEKIIEDGINNSQIKRDDLLEAYRLLINLKISVNKLNEAKYYAKQVSENFNNPLSKIYGRIALAKIYIRTRNYQKAISILKKELVKTSDLEIATIIADELYDAYLLNKEDPKAFALTKKVLTKNMDYYANDSYHALKKIKKLVKAEMPEFAIDILRNLLKNATIKESIDSFKFLLASIYMDLSGYKKEYMSLAKVIYEELIKEKNHNPYRKKAKMILDEIIMREGNFDPQMIASKYSTSESMQDKALMQELINAIRDERYEQIIRMKKIYTTIYPPIIKRFGYQNMKEIYDLVNAKMVKLYLRSDQCQHLNTVLKGVSEETLQLITTDNNITTNLFDCMFELPNKTSYQIIKKAYSQLKNGEIYFKLEQIAILLNKYEDANKFSQKLDMLNILDEPNLNEILSDEFLYRFLIYGHKDSAFTMSKFFDYAKKNEEFIYNNQNNPMIIDFYYQYYLYLLKQQEEEDATDILYKLFDKQNEMKARIYSPFVEIEIAKLLKLDDNYEEALKYLKIGLKIKRTQNGITTNRAIKGEDLAHIYYEMAKIYEHLNKVNRAKGMIKKCKNLKNVDSFYKKMCDNS